MGSFIYRTCQGLNKNQLFLETLQGYQYADSCLIDGKFRMRYYPGTYTEINEILNFLSKDPEQSQYKFPALFNFQSVQETYTGQEVYYRYTIALVGSVFHSWITEQREAQVFDLLLRPVYDEFMRQVMEYPYLDLGYGYPSHRKLDRFTTGEPVQKTMFGQYGDFIDAIEIHELVLKQRNDLCQKHIDIINQENDAVIRLTNN